MSKTIDFTSLSPVAAEALFKSIEQVIEDSIIQAREACSLNGSDSGDCAVAWDIVEELQAERSHRLQAKTAFQRYCDENPNADECRIYDV